MRSSDTIRHDDDRRHATSIFDAALWGYCVKLSCRCRNTGLFEAHGLWWRFKRKGWSDDFRDARRRFYCKSCSARLGRRIRPEAMETCGGPPRIRMTLPDEREWKRAVGRYRG